MRSPAEWPGSWESLAMAQAHLTTGGGLWAVNDVTFTPGTTPFLLTSAQAVRTA